MEHFGLCNRAHGGCAPNSEARSGERIKTNLRDAVYLARLHRAGVLTGVWVLDVVHEAVRELVRARESGADDLRRKRQQLLYLLLRLVDLRAAAIIGPWRTGARYDGCDKSDPSPAGNAARRNL
ncbi:hypothetical protein BQ8794_240204 [Mesorhizobium prunaredense]|uniref:Transposase n=1 Tax=Mesorhizobium prunaredense TaxID=1631249 RepID=A0A1R3V7W5_9HYPH|nr:hypothetical protein BQ8794_240204 [Mesorhizobium prunaredense]